MIEKLQQLEKLNRNEVFNAINVLFDTAENVKVYRHLQDYSGNYSEAYNYYVALNTKALEQELCDFFMDNVLLEGNKKIEHTYFVKFPISTYIAYEALKVSVLNELKQMCFVTNVEINSDFVVFDNDAVVVLDFTNEGALIGGSISTNPDDVKLALAEYERTKINASKFLEKIKPEQTINKHIKHQIKVYKDSLAIK